MPESGGRTHQLVERDWMVTALSGALLVFSTAVTAVVDDGPKGTTAAIVVLTVVAAVWLVIGRSLNEPTLWSGVWFVGIAALYIALAAQSPLYGFVVWSGYLFVPRTLPIKLFPAGVAAVAAGSALSQIGGEIKTTGDIFIYAALVLVNGLVAGVVMWFAVVADAQNEERRVALEELERTMAEKEALQQQLVEQARDAGVADERGRLAREIHDTIAQGLAGIVTQLEAAQAGPGPEADRHIEAAQRLARESLSEARRSVDALRPEPLHGARLPDAIQDVTAKWSALHGIPAEVHTTGDAEPMRPELEVALLRTAQEGLANVAKHARASRVGVTLSYMGDHVALDLRDDGVGFVPPTNGHSHNGGFGLQSMRERVVALDGRLAIESEPGAGTAVSATVPAMPA